MKINSMLSFTFPNWDRELFMFLNSKHIWWLDPIMYYLSTHTGWAIVCLLVIIYIIYSNKITGKRAAFFMLLGIGINSLINNIIKFFIMRPRPGNDHLIGDIIRELEDVGNSYSFFSAHSSNSICLALFASLYLRNRYFGILLFAWALTVAYSRIYVGKHYPLDVICGIIFGFITGYTSYIIYKRYSPKKDSLKK